MTTFNARFPMLASKIATGMKTGNISIKKLGIDHATVQRIYRQMRNDKYDGSLVFYVCEKSVDEVLEKIIEGLRMLDKLNNKFPDTQEIISKLDCEKDEDILFCALQGALIKSKDRVGMKCLDIIVQLYLSAAI